MSNPQANLTEPAPLLSIPQGRERSRSNYGWVVFWAVLLVLIAAAAGIIPRIRQRSALRVETIQLSIPSVLVTSPQPGGTGGAVALPAEVRPLIEAQIHARASGYVRRWLVDLGAKVQAGQLLAEIDTPDLDQELARAKAEVNQADAAIALAKITAGRWSDLLKTSSVSEQEAAEKQSDLALKSANLEAAHATVRRLEELQSFGRVIAPFAGTITARLVDVGELIAAGSGRELFRLAQTGTLRVYVHVPQTLARLVVPGQIAEMMVPELVGRRIPAKIVRTSGAMEAVSRTLLTELEVDNSAGEILSGSYAEVRFPDSKAEAVLALPSGTLLFRAEGSQVGVVKADGVVELRTIVIGRDFGPTFEVISGVSPSDRVIINPSDSLTQGAKVRAVDANAVAPSGRPVAPIAASK